MVVEFYFDNELAYGNKYRYLSLSEFTPEAKEEQKSIIFGDGTQCSFKTKAEKFFNSDNKSATYITVTTTLKSKTDNNEEEDKNIITRWFVAYWKYLNGSQVEVYLRRDIIGEYGIGDLFAQIDRGYVSNTNKLKFKQELTLNNKLINRIKLIPTTNDYGSISVDNHDHETWGILYYIQSTDEDAYKISIPAFSPTAAQDTFNITLGKNIAERAYSSCSYFIFHIYLHLKYTKGIHENFFFDISYRIYPFNAENNYYTISEIEEEHYSDDEGIGLKINIDIANTNSNGNAPSNSETVAQFILNTFNNTYQSNGGSTLKAVGGYTYTYDDKSKFPDNNVNALVLTLDDKTYTNSTGTSYYVYKVSQTTVTDSFSRSNADSSFLINFFNNILIPKGLSNIWGTNETRCELRADTSGSNSDGRITSSQSPKYIVYDISTEEIDPKSAGVLELKAAEQLIFEPFQILVCPLYDCVIKYSDRTFNITKQQAFNVFNNVIAALSGENGYIIDAQIYPYCPVLSNLASELDINVDDNSKIFDMPFFNIASSNYSYYIKAILPAQDDVKREYDMHNYRMVSPDQSGTYDFKYYDYKDVSDDDEKEITVEIKTCLKPYTIVTTALIIPDNNNLKGITYESDLRGANATGKGFEATMTSNAFETYARQNSNYQELYQLSKEELTLSQNVERNSEITSVVTNTLASAGYGATAGSSLMSSIPFVGSSIGAAVGAGIGVAASLTAGITEIQANDEMREFEQRQLEAEYNYNLQTIKNLPDSLNQVSSFNEILLQDFWYVIEVYACTIEEANVDIQYYNKLSYDLGICGQLIDYVESGKFIKATVLQCTLPVQYVNLLNEDLNGGVYIILNEEENNNGGESEL